MSPGTDMASGVALAGAFAGGAASRGAPLTWRHILRAFLARVVAVSSAQMEKLVPLPLLADAARCVGSRLTGDADATGCAARAF
jgi:hypothetical protein